MIKYDFINSSSDGLKIELAYTIPKEEIKGIVQFSHGMAEHKERYFNFMEYLSNNGYVCVINDHRGHGNSVKDKKDLGYFYTEDTNFIIDDLHDVTKYIKEKSGKTFGELVKNVRMKKARTLLKGGNMTVESIAEKVGYQNVEHFTRLFKKKYGMTPVQFRNEEK